MPRNYDNDYALCPFFQTSGRKDIVCEGIQSGCVTKLVFSSERGRNRYRTRFCDTQYANCEICKLLERKYD